MPNPQADRKYLEDRAAREVALAQATGSKAHASPDNKTVFVQRPDGSTETVHLRPREN